jgi:hypothetical protein
MAKEKGPITKTWLEARKCISENRLEEAEQVLDKGILMLSHLTYGGCGDKQLVEKVKMEVWKERFWITIEKYIWPTFPDYEKNWKM